MTEQTYRIKPLEWKARHHNSFEGPVQYATTANGEYVVKSPNGPFSRCWVNGIPYMDEASCKKVAWLGHVEAIQAKWLDPVSTALDRDSIIARLALKRGVEGIVGKWPGDETNEEIEALLRDDR